MSICDLIRAKEIKRDYEKFRKLREEIIDLEKENYNLRVFKWNYQ